MKVRQVSGRSFLGYVISFSVKRRKVTVYIKFSRLRVPAALFRGWEDPWKNVSGYIWLQMKCLRMRACGFCAPFVVGDFCEVQNIPKRLPTEVSETLKKLTSRESQYNSCRKTCGRRPRSGRCARVHPLMITALERLCL